MKFHRQLLALSLSAALTAGMTITASAQGTVTVSVNGTKSNVSAFTNADWRTMVPAEIADSLGLSYTAQDSSVTFTGNGISQTYTAGVPVGDTTPAMVAGKLYVPFYHLAQTFGFEVSWDGAARNADAAAGKADTDSVAPIDLNAYLLDHTEKTNDTTRALPIDRTEVNEHPLTGYYGYTLSNGRTIKLYMPEHAALRSYITVIAIPNGVTDTYAFLEEQGWIEQADQYGELLFVLEPANGTWGSVEAERDYLNICIGETVGNTAFDTRSTSNSLLQSGTVSLSDGTSCPVFTGHSCNYYVGYDEGCAVLESWTSNNPMYVAAQALIAGKSAGSEVLDHSAARTYNGINTGSYYPGIDDTAFAEQLGKMAAEKASPSAQFIKNSDIPVPTLLAGYSEQDESVAYWKSVNDAVSTSEEGVYRQSLNSDAWQTAYANDIAKRWGAQYGISQVKVTQETSLSAAEVHDFMDGYTRYTNPFAYSNALGVRTDYYQTTKAAREAAENGKVLSSYAFEAVDGQEKTVELRALKSTRLTNPGGSAVSGTLYSCISAFHDYDGNGVMDPRETIMYIPDTAKKYGEDGAPVVVVFPGNTQAAATFFDCSMWWSIANDEGCAVIIIGEYCKNSAAGLTYGDESDNADFSRSALQLMDRVVSQDAGVKINMERVYGSGHSLGCRTVQTLTHNSEAGSYAAVGATSFPNAQFTADDRMPSYLLVGQADISEALPDPRANDLVKDPWTVTADSAIYNWVRGACQMNGLDFSFTPNDHNSFLSTCSEYVEAGRYYTYTWADEAQIPLVQFTRTLAREHNCYPEEFRLAWDFLEHYSLSEDGTRYYSPSAFEKDDAVAIS